MYRASLRGRRLVIMADRGRPLRAKLVVEHRAHAPLWTCTHSHSNEVRARFCGRQALAALYAAGWVNVIPHPAIGVV